MRIAVGQGGLKALDKVIEQLGQNGILAALVIVAIVIILVPLILRLSGLSGSQIVDVIKLTLQFFVNIAQEYRAQNQAGKVKRK